MADWYGSREQLMSLHGLDTAMLGYGMGAAAAAAFPPIQPDAYAHAHAAHHVAAAAYTFQRQHQSVSSSFPHACFGSDQQWRHNSDGSIMELRKEKSRDAARSRRGKENYEFYELAKMLPLPGAITSQLDKASIIRLTISYLKLRDFTLHGDPPWHRESNLSKSLKGGTLRHRPSNNLTIEMFEQHQGTHILQSLDGFAFNLAADGRFLYISETVSIYLGLSQVEMTGSSVFDYIHTEDHQELADQLCLTLSSGQPLPSPSSLGSEENSGSNQGTMNPDVATGMTMGSTATYKGYERSFCIRMKSTLTKRGCHFKSSGYRVVLILGHMRPQMMFSHARKVAPQVLGFVALAIALPPPSVHEVRLESDMFVTRLLFNFQIAHCEPRVTDLLDYTPEDFQGRSLYSLVHGQDVEKIKKTHNDLMKKGQVMSPYFRILNKRGGYTWMQICATIICNTKSGEEQTIICVNYVLSNCQYESEMIDEFQLDPNLTEMKSDSHEYPSSGTPESSGDLSRVREGEENRGCISPVGVSGTTSLTTRGSQSPSSSSVPEPLNTPLRGTPDAPAEGAPIKKEVPGGLLTPMGSAEISPEERHRSSVEGRSTPIGRISSPSSTPCTIPSRTLSTVVAPSLPLPSSLETSPSGVRSEEGSVRDLEAAMTRHLPDEAPDFSTEALLRGSSGVANGAGHRSTIQWVGTPGGQQSSLPASTLLRQLYANRESVIRTSVQRSYYTDAQAALPTPPGPDGYHETMFVKNHDFSYNGGNTAANGGLVGMSGSSYTDYHSAMTPPSSVSPREKMAGDCGDMRAASSYLSEASMPTQPLPLKPQVYSYGPSSVSLDAPAYSSTLAEQPSSLYTHSGFHLYHTNASKSSGPYDTLRTGTSWYAPSS